MGWATGSGWQGTAVVPGTLTVGDTVVVSSSTQSGSAAFQAGNFDFNVGAGYGSSTATAPVYGAGVMGNILGANLTLAENILAGVIGKYDITGTNASTKGKAAVIGTIGDQASSADAAFLAILGGDTGTSTPGAAFAVMSQNSTVASKFSFGLDLYRAAIESYGPVTYGTAAIRLPNASWIMGRNAADSANVNMFQVTTGDAVAVPAGAGTSTARVSGTLLDWDTTTATTAGTSAETLKSLTIPANTLDAAGKSLKITVVMGTAVNGNNKLLRVLLGTSEIFTTGTRTDSNQNFYLVAHVTRVDATNQNFIYTRIMAGAASTSFGTITENLAIALTLTLEGTTSNQAGDLTVREWKVEYE